ncbi:hypothetical protein SASPL_150744 [Salvia splendens]|uniref:Dynamin GTPase n=1 Tax=Salvia splendens TaxID=180675 RepID=A0A8X8Z2Y7_SALSN|nr:dynamin-related protein 4C-like [Salvia splendens]KAG6389279.1 hypothetical protein SASPL_150744 [Salvia splendens]
MNLLKISKFHFHQAYKQEDESPPLMIPHDAPIVSPYNQKIRPLLDTVDTLRHLKIMQEGIQLPTNVVVGDQSSGKSSVLESLAGIRLPRGDGICTRVPLIMSLKNHTSPEPQLFLEFNGTTVETDEENVVDEIIYTTQEVAGKGKGVSNTPLTLVVKKNGVPDLTMIDLPGITRVPVKGQPEDISEQIRDIIMKYITPDESIILNVLSAGVDFPTCESIKMSQSVDKTGERTLAVVTKADKSPEGLLEKIVADDVNIGLGYVCVINRIGDETYEEARAREAKLFASDPLLSRIDKSIVGIPALAEKLAAIQASIIAKCLPEIVRKINEKLSANVEELNKMPKNLSSISDAMTEFMNILGSARDSLNKNLLHGEFDDYLYAGVNPTAKLAEMLNKFSEELRSAKSESKEDFLGDEIMALENRRLGGLPNFIPKSAIRSLLGKKMKEISTAPFECAEKIWNCIETVVISVLLQHCDYYPQIIPCARRAAKNLIARKKQNSVEWISDLLEMEKLTDYTCNPEFSTYWNKLMSEQGNFMARVRARTSPAAFTLSRYGEVKIGHLWCVNSDMVQTAYDLKMKMAAYWDVVTGRMVDNLVLHLLCSIQKLLNKEMQKEIINEVMGPQGNGLEKMLEELPAVSEKRKKLHSSITLLKQAKDIIDLD